MLVIGGFLRINYVNIAATKMVLSTSLVSAVEHLGPDDPDPVEASVT
jgi:hypothetical protein